MPAQNGRETAERPVSQDDFLGSLGTYGNMAIIVLRPKSTTSDLRFKFYQGNGIISGFLESPQKWISERGGRSLRHQ